MLFAQKPIMDSQWIEDQRDTSQLDKLINSLTLSPWFITQESPIEPRILNIRTPIGYIVNDISDKVVPEPVYNTSPLVIFTLRLHLELEVYRLTNRVISMTYHFDRE